VEHIFLILEEHCIAIALRIHVKKPRGLVETETALVDSRKFNWEKGN